MTIPTRRIVSVGVPAVAAGLGFLLGAACHRPKLSQACAELAIARREAEHDHVTGLPNRAGLQRHHERLIAARTAPTAVLVDLDDFKSVNDTWGHQAGDVVLVAVAERLAQGCGRLDAVAGRLAGDEFLLLLPHVTGHDALETVQALLCELGRPIALSAGEGGTVILLPAASAGIALPEPRGEQASAWSDLIRRADAALYHAKLRSGRAVLHTAGMCHPPRSSGRSTAVGRRRAPTAPALTSKSVVWRDGGGAWRHGLGAYSSLHASETGP